MKVEVLVATMNQSDFSIADKMNIKTDCVIANQTDCFQISNKVENESEYTMVSTTSRGVGINRNTALMYANADILIFADDDVVYFDDYCELITKAYRDNPKADAVIFNLSVESGRKMIKKKKRVRWYNFMRYGTVRVSIRKSSLDKANIWFSSLYGGGARYSCGEDTLFLRECLRKKLRIISVPITLAELTNDRLSTWDNGDLEKQAYDKGILLKNAFPVTSILFKYVFAFKMKSPGAGYYKNLKLIKKGMKDFKNNLS